MEEIISFEDFSKIDLRVGRILKVENHPNASKLFVLSVSFGKEERTICAGLREFYSAEELEGKEAIFVFNLAPRELRGVTSEGMILAASIGEREERKVVILTPEKEISAGSRVS